MDRRAVLRALSAAAVGGTVGGVAELGLQTATSEPGRSARPGPTRGGLAAPVVWRGGGGRRAVALTFDDGPHPHWTPLVLDLLARHGARATFFCVGERAVAHAALVRRTAAAGHELGNHTWTHCRLIAAAPARIDAELRRTHRALTALASAPPVLLRPPWGEIDAPGLLAAAELGYRVALWSSRVRGRSPAADATETLHDISPGSVVLAHDGGRTPNHRLLRALDGMLGALRRDGYALVPMSELLAG
jgi:peptidoglycan/xylan/chitin deacetylase (PgdA/CDA1 family)